MANLSIRLTERQVTLLHRCVNAGLEAANGGNNITQDQVIPTDLMRELLDLDELFMQAAYAATTGESSKLPVASPITVRED